MTDIKIDIEKCKGCEFCIDACPIDDIKMSKKMNKKGFHYAEMIDKEKCTGCGMCFQMCPDLAIEIKKNDQ
jgi:2-oxoglutarate ferredoxin oxidoreductase subunit delta|tara:strand:+ start:512 stop:724 length:213 start_codon:yes stop_codon:yes gene_type:complete